MALGNAYTSLVEDDEALFYNPAGIAKNGGIFWKIADPRVGVSDPTALKGVSNLQSSSENQSAASSRITDADFATETANLSRAQILSQAGTAMIAQANQLPQQVLKLLQ